MVGVQRRPLSHPSPQGMLLRPLAPHSEAPLPHCWPGKYLGSLEGESGTVAAFHRSSELVGESWRAQHVAGTLMVAGRQ